MNRKTRLVAGALACTTFAAAFTPSAFAAAPQVTTDEAMYVNMDYYGKPTNTSVVKSNSLNGNTSFVDYGSYEKVINMSNHAKPQITQEGIKWNLPKDTKNRFYYEVTPKKGTVQLPWDFNVSYKLNGVPKKGEELAGASGLIEITVDCVPNSSAKQYYQNNMLLTCMTAVDLDKTLSVDAPGAQIQSAGNYKAVVFMAVPGEKKTFTMRIGSESFETPGIIFAMMPGTMEQLKKVKDLKEAKDTVEDSADAVYGNLDDMLSILNSMSSGLESTRSGLQQLDQFRAAINNNKDKNYAEADKALSDLTKTAQQMNTLLPHLQNAQTLVQEVNTDTNRLITTLDGTQSHLYAYKQSLSSLQDDMQDIQDALDDDSSDSKKRKKAMRDLKDDMGDMSKSFNQINNDVKQLEEISKQLGVVLPKIPAIQQWLASDPQQNIPMLQGLSDSLSAILKSTGSTVTSLKGVTDSGSDAISTLEDVMEFDDLSNAADDMDELMDTGKKSLDLMSTLVTNIDTLNADLNKHKDGSIQLLQKSSALVEQLSNSINSTVTFMQTMKDTLQDNSDVANEGTRKMLLGLVDTLQNGLNLINKNKDLKDQNTLIHDTLKDKIDDYTDDNHLLDMDAEAALVSFTSEKNPAPSSIQIVLRTQEISVEDAEKPADMETQAEDIGPWGRVVQLFQKMWNGVTSLFKK